ncbi:MAG: hypothetical protein RLZZ624_446 [Cyanobacteriota bacterium]|jgi:hypothetical protein
MADGVGVLPALMQRSHRFSGRKDHNIAATIALK